MSRDGEWDRYPNAHRGSVLFRKNVPATQTDRICYVLVAFQRVPNQFGAVAHAPGDRYHARYVDLVPNETRSLFWQ